MRPSDSPIPFVQSGSYPVRPGNSVRPLVDGEPAFRRICEAIAAARHSVWVTVTFMWAGFQMPGGRGSALDVLDEAAARGLDVRLIFWRPDATTDYLKRNAFWGSAEHVAQLEARRSGVKIRWDRAHPGFCQHQKSWLIDAGTGQETAFVGGINLNPHSVAAPGHHGEAQNHDAYAELRGPCTVDVHHNFVQRWNSAHEGRWGAGSDADLAWPEHVPARCGHARVQIQRTVHAGLYPRGPATPGGPAFDIGLGERSNFDQYCVAIAAARRSIYIENQYVEVPEIVAGLQQALQRGVVVVLVMPAEPDIQILATDGPERQAFGQARAALGCHEHFTLAGLAGLGSDGRRKPVWVHAKLMLVDDEWATLGSCNLHSHSLFGNSELNAAFQDRQAVRGLRIELLAEHLGQDTSHLDDRAALTLFGRVARENQHRLAVDNHAWQGLAFALDPATHRHRAGR